MRSQGADGGADSFGAQEDKVIGSLLHRLKLSPAASVRPGEVQPRPGAEAEPGSEWPGLSLGFCLTCPPPPGREGQGEGISDLVMAASVSKGQMVFFFFPGVSELMTVQQESG